MLIVCVELCSIHLQQSSDDEHLLANSLFGDGAAATVITSGGYGRAELELEKFHNALSTDGKAEMGWYVGDFGFEMRLSHNVPNVIQSGIKKLTDQLLQTLDLTISEVQYYAIHPGGKKILQVIEEALDIGKDDNRDAHEILRRAGNMSSPTVLFVLQGLMNRIKEVAQSGERVLSFAFGPGLTLESMLLRIAL